MTRSFASLRMTILMIENWNYLSAGGSSNSPTAFSPGIAYRSSAQAPKSIILQRSLQNGRNGLSLLNSVMVPHCGHRTGLGIILQITIS